MPSNIIPPASMQLHAIRKYINSLPAKEYQLVDRLHDDFRKIVVENGTLGAVALALLGAELAAEADGVNAETTKETPHAL